MKFDFKKNHVTTAILYNLTMLIIIFSSQEPIVILAVLISYCAIFTLQGKLARLLGGMKLFLPFAALTILINLMFVQQGSMVIVTIAGKALTIESLIFSITTSFKLLVVIYIFEAMGSMIDSDRAVSYFSSRMPKSTLTLMITFKLIPGMKKKITRLREVYSLRGMQFEDNSLMKRIKNSIPVLSVLLESSLEGAFDIGEAAYVRGFLSGRRSVYEKQTLKFFDYIMLASEVALIILYLFLLRDGYMGYSPYGEHPFKGLVTGPKTIFALTILVIAGIVIYRARENRHGIFGN